MFETESADEVKCYEFSWELIDYDCGPPKFRSPNFTLSFQITEWFMELDFSELKNRDFSVPFRLQRIPDIGPKAITLDVKATVRLGPEVRDGLKGKYGLGGKDSVVDHFVQSRDAKVFSENKENYWAFNIPFPIEKRASNDWLSPKTLVIKIEMKAQKQSDKEFAKKEYWYTPMSLVKVRNGLKILHDEGYNHNLVLKVSGEEFRLHKYILNVRWPKLMSVLGIGESLEKEEKEFSGIPPTIMKHFLKFAYYGDTDFIYHLEEIENGVAVFDLARKFNFYRLNDKLIQLSPKCSCSQALQSFRTSFEMKLKNVTSTEYGVGDFKTCEVPLKPRHLPTPPQPLDAEGKEKFHQHIRFMDVRLYVQKGPFGYQWLRFSVVLGKLPEERSLTMKCKLYVVPDVKKKCLLTEQNLVFDRATTEIRFKTPFSKDKELKRYQKVAEPVITWRELIDESRNFTRKRIVRRPNGEEIEERDIYFRFEFKFTDGERTHSMRHEECEIKMFDFDDKIFEDLEKIYSSQKFTNIEIKAGEVCISAHKALLAARCKKLSDLIRKQPDLKTLPINIKPSNLQRFLHYIYTGQMFKDPERVDEFISVASEFELECLREILTREMLTETPMIL